MAISTASQKRVSTTFSAFTSRVSRTMQRLICPTNLSTVSSTIFTVDPADTETAVYMDRKKKHDSPNRRKNQLIARPRARFSFDPSSTTLYFKFSITLTSVPFLSPSRRNSAFLLGCKFASNISRKSKQIISV